MNMNIDEIEENIHYIQLTIGINVYTYYSLDDFIYKCLIKNNYEVTEVRRDGWRNRPYFNIAKPHLAAYIYFENDKTANSEDVMSIFDIKLKKIKRSNIIDEILDI